MLKPGNADTTCVLNRAVLCDFLIYCVLESKNEINKNEFQKKDNRIRYSLAGKEEELCTRFSSFDSRGSNDLNNFNSIKDNITKQNQLMNNLENNIDVCSTKYGNLILFFCFLWLHQLSIVLLYFETKSR